MPLLWTLHIFDACCSACADAPLFKRSCACCSVTTQAVHCGMMCRYQGYDWRDRRNWGCNNKKSPVGQGLFNNSTLSLYDLLFVKVKTSLIEAGDTTAQLAVKYTAWMSGSERPAGTQ